jgi:ABC-2 type transport system permease protein
MSDTTVASSWTIIENAGLIKKVYVPKILFPMTKTYSNIVNLFFSLIALIIVMLITKVPFHMTALLVFIPIVFCMIFTMGLSAMLSSLSVIFRDVPHIYTVLIMLWMYATPIFYPRSLLEDSFPWVLSINPMFHYIDYFRSLVLEGKIPGLKENIICAAFAIVFFGIGTVVLIRNQNKFILYL